MERLTEKFKDRRNILRKGISDIFYIGFGRFFEGEAIDRLAEYEDLEERNRLLKLPCAVGDMVYVKMQSGEYAEAEVRDFTYFLTCGFCIVVTSDKFDKQNIPFSEFGKTVFLTKEEAEAALKELEGRNETD